MRDLLLLAVQLVVTIAKLVRPGGVHCVIAESLILKHERTQCLGESLCTYKMGQQTRWLVDESSRSSERKKTSINCELERGRDNGLEPYAYLKHLFTKLPKAQTVEDFEALLPFKNPAST